MKAFVPLLCLSLLLSASVAHAQSAYQSRQLPPGMWDLRVGVEADGLLSHAGGQLAADVGLVPLGEGMLAVGLEGGFSRCLLGCGSSGTVLVDRTSLTPMARVLWHFPVGAETPNVSELGMYVGALGGASFAFQQAREGGARLETNQVVPIFGAAIGSLYFPGNGDTVFAGGELRVLYALPTREVDGPGLVVTPWSLAGVRLVFTMGVRL